MSRRTKSRQHRREFLLDSPSQKSRRTKKVRNRFLNVLSRVLFVQKISKLFRTSVLFSVLFSLMALFIVFALATPYFHLKKISVVRDNPNLDVVQIEKSLEEFYGENILFLPHKNIREKLSTDFPEFRDVSIYENWPSEIELKVEISPPRFNLLNTESANFSVISEDGVILQEEPDEDLPVLKIFQYEKPIQIRQQFLSKEDLDKIEQAENILEGEIKLPLHASHVYWTARELHLISQTDMEIWIDLSQDIKPQMRKLELSAAEIGLYTNRFEHIDLRIPKQIFWKRKL
jgi:cell division septal protein FtsQ